MEEVVEVDVHSHRDLRNKFSIDCQCLFSYNLFRSLQIVYIKHKGIYPKITERI